MAGKDIIMLGLQILSEKMGMGIHQFFIGERWDLRFGLRRQMEKGLRKDREMFVEHKQKETSRSQPPNVGDNRCIGPIHGIIAQPKTSLGYAEWYR